MQLVLEPVATPAFVRAESLVIERRKAGRELLSATNAVPRERRRTFTASQVVAARGAVASASTRNPRLRDVKHVLANQAGDVPPVASVSVSYFPRDP